MLKDYFAAILAVALWIVNLLTLTPWGRGLSAPQGRVLGGAAILAGVWAIRDRRRTQPGPDKITMSPADYMKLLETVGAAGRARLSEENDGGGGCAKRPA